MKALPELGEVRRSKLEVQDVTRSHSELEEQIKNMKAEVEGLRGLLKKPTDVGDTAAAFVMLAKNGSITGQVIVVDAGLLHG